MAPAEVPLNRVERPPFTFACTYELRNRFAEFINLGIFGGGLLINRRRKRNIVSCK